MSSNIFELQESYDPNTQEPVLDLEVASEDELIDALSDGDLPISYRVEILHKLASLNQDTLNETINRLIGFYNFTPTEILKNFLIAIAEISHIELNLRMECARALYDDEKMMGYAAFLVILSDITPEYSLPVPIQIEIYRYLFEEESHFELVSQLFNEQIVKNEVIDNDYRYKILVTIQRDTDRYYYEPYLHQAYLAIVKDIRHNYTRYRILASQYILLAKLPEETKLIAQEVCMGFALDTILDYNLRADAADVLLRLSITTDGTNVGRNIITLLGQDHKGVHNVYNDRQNVHTEEIEKSVEEVILYLASLETKVDNKGEALSFPRIQDEIEKLVVSEEFLRKQTVDLEQKSEEEVKIESSEEWQNLSPLEQQGKRAIRKIRASLYRILIDGCMYAGNQTLQGIFIKIWQYITSHESVTVLKERMCEELIDMSNTCTTGHVNRIINVLSAFGFTLNIGWKKQIEANVSGRLTAKIKSLPDEEMMLALLDEMAWSTRLEERINFNRFVRDNINPIRDEMYGEFVVDGKYITHDEFEDHFREAIMKFES